MPDVPKKPWRISANDRRFLRSLHIKAEEGETMMTGQRLPDGNHETMPPGSYCRNERGVWECCTPNQRRGTLENHQITEHPDGSISVAPSIRVDPITNQDGSEFRPGWHGFLEAGVWREC